MFFLWRRKKKKSELKKEAEIQALKEDAFKSIDEATESTKKAADAVSSKPDITLQIFYATGGDRRGVH